MRRLFSASFVLFLTSSLFAAGQRLPLQRVEESFSSLEVSGRSDAPQRIEKLQLPGLGERNLIVEPFDVFAPDATITIVDDKGSHQGARPPLRLYRGHIEGDERSIVFITRDVQMHGLVITGDDQKFVLGPENDLGLAPKGTRRSLRDDLYEAREVNDEDALGAAAKGWRCGVDDGPNAGPLTSMMKAIAPATTTTGSPTYTARIAVDTDFELRNILGSSAAVVNYVTSLVGAASTIYQRDLKTTLQLGNIYAYDTDTDPWTLVPGGAVGTRQALDQLGTVYHTDATRAALSRSSVVMLSAKNWGGGIAWIGVTCGGDFATSGANWGGAYAFCGSVGGSFSTVNPSLYWDILEFTHELGHNFNSPHTHCIALNAADTSAFARSYVDNCYSGESGCFSGTASVPAEKGTIMSYCHLRAGGYNNIRLIFGQAGEASRNVMPPMISYIDGQTPSANITAPASMTAGNSGTASVPNVAGLTYSWAISNGTITSAANLNSVTFTANASPLTLSVTLTKASGCAVTNSVSITVNPATPCSAAGTALSVDPTAGGSANGNGIFEPGEQVAIKTQWTNNGAGSLTLSALATSFSAAGSTILDNSASFGAITAGNSAFCSNCYAVALGVPASRPTHWDGYLAENATGTPSCGAQHTYAVHIGNSFSDAGQSNIFYPFIERLLHNNVTGGCDASAHYCPGDIVSRDQMAAFIARSMVAPTGDNGIPSAGTVTGRGNYNCIAGGTSLFTDVAANSTFCKQIHYMLQQGISTGCLATSYCPGDSVSRRAMSSFIARALVSPHSDTQVPLSYSNPANGRSYNCTTGAGLSFTDVPLSDVNCKQIYYIWARGVVDGLTPTTFDPEGLVARDAMAKFLSNAFNLTTN